MTRARTRDYAARYNLVCLLSHEDIGRVGVSDTVVDVMRGESYLDLGHLELGVQQATTSEQILMGRLLPRSAVSESTWNTILGLLASRPLKPFTPI